jgi:choline dehydrogenase-like flavoprotein
MAGIKFVEKVVQSAHMAPFVGKRTYPPPEVNTADPEHLKAAIEEFQFGTYHPIGTCALGEVLEGDCRVKGVKNLRVVDASIFPNHVSGNICSSVYATAENVADMIKQEYGWL